MDINVCLWSLETVRMTRLLKEPNTPATSLKEDVERMVDKVNEFAKQSIPSLLAALLTGQMFLVSSSMFQETG